MRGEIFIGAFLFTAIFALELTYTKQSYAQHQIENAHEVIQDIQKSHIEGNIPAVQNFDRILNRDIKRYFEAQSIAELSVQYEMLRDGPTQSGVSFPKFYLWVKIFSKNNLYVEGAMRVAAVEKEKFEITDFLSKSDIKEHPNAVGNIFPAMLIENILSRASE